VEVRYGSIVFLTLSTRTLLVCLHARGRTHAPPSLVWQLCGRTLRVDHVENYRLPKHLAEKEAKKNGSDTVQPISAVQAGHAYQGTELASQFTLEQGQDLFALRPPPSTSQRQEGPIDPSNGDDKDVTRRESKARKKDKEAKRMAKEKRRQERHAKRTEREERRRQRRAQSMISSTAAGGDDVDSDRHKQHGRRRHDDSSESSGSDDSDASRRKPKRRKHA
jgi:hypothetical protein